MFPALSLRRNFLTLLSGNVLSAVAALATSIWLARVLGPEGFGLLGFGSAVVAYFALLVAFGSDLWGARTIASKRYSAPMIAGRILGLRIWLLIFGLVLFLVLQQTLRFDHIEKSVLWIQILSILAVPLSLDYFFQGIQRQTNNAVRQTCQAGLYFVLIFLFVRSSSDLISAATAQTVSVIIPTLVIFILSYKRYKLFPPDFSLKRLMGSMKRVVPFSISAFVNTVFFTIDILMLGFLTSNTEVGLYVVGVRLILAALAPAGLIFAVGFPKLSETRLSERASHLRLYSTILGLVAVSGCVVGLSMPSTVIGVIFGEEFRHAVPVFFIQVIIILVVYARMAPGAGLSSWGLQKVHARATSVAALINILLNAILIPNHGAAGAAIATLFSQIILLGLFSFELRRHTKISVFGAQTKTLLCGLIAGVAVYALGNVLSGIGLLVGGIALSIVTVFVTAKLIGLLDWAVIQSFLRPPANS